MGNKLGRRRYVVDDKYTRPQGLYHIKDVDMKKLRKLILESKLAPCYPGDEDCSCEFEECPICFLFYPSLNRSKCCTKGICTECFLQMKTPNSTLPTQCPFCKTSNYAVEYRGLKTKEEKGMEQIEEQRVIEAKIRMRQQELQDDEERMHKRQEISSSVPLEVEHSPLAVPSSTSAMEVEEIVSSQELCTTPVIQRPPHSRTTRDDEFDLDLEDIMVMEAIWLSIQENERQINHRSYVETAPSPSNQYVAEDQYISPAMVTPSTAASTSASPSGGLACAIAALAEHQQTGGDSSINHNRGTVVSNTTPSDSRFYNRVGQESERYSSAQSSDIHSPERRAIGDWNVDHGSEMAEARTSYAGSDATDDGIEISGSLPPPPPDFSVGSFETVADPIVPESFEEQMMLAMAVSLAEVVRFIASVILA